MSFPTMEEVMEETGLEVGEPKTGLEETIDTTSSSATPFLKMREGISKDHSARRIFDGLDFLHTRSNPLCGT